jgi:hypothetical protein
MPERPAITRMVDRDVIVRSLGKFEGERTIVAEAYSIYLDGFADDDDGEAVTVEVPVAWRGSPDTPCEWETVRFIVDGLGFVCEVN